MNRVKQRLAVGGTALVFTLTAGVVVAPLAEAKSMTLAQFYSTKSYPFAGYSSGNSPAALTKGWCADYAVWAWEHWTGTKFDHVRTQNFKSTALNRGYKVGTKPKAGALAVWTSHRTHFAYVYSYRAGAATFRVREVRWNTVGPSFRDIGATGIGPHASKSPKPDFFIYKK